MIDTKRIRIFDVTPVRTAGTTAESPYAWSLRVAFDAVDRRPWERSTRDEIVVSPLQMRALMKLTPGAKVPADCVGMGFENKYEDVHDPGTAFKRIVQDLVRHVYVIKVEDVLKKASTTAKSPKVIDYYKVTLSFLAPEEFAKIRGFAAWVFYALEILRSLFGVNTVSTVKMTELMTLRLMRRVVSSSPVFLPAQCEGEYFLVDPDWVDVTSPDVALGMLLNPGT